MKKKFFSLMAVSALLLTAVSCSQDEFENEASGNQAKVSFNVGFEGVAATRTIGDGKTVDEVLYEVYDATGEKCVAEGSADVSDRQATVNVTLVKGATYKVLFWAQKKDANVYNTADLRAITVQGYAGNAENRDAFYKAEEVTVGNGSLTRTVTLNRPFAQLNVGTNSTDYTAAQTLGTTITKSKVLVKGLATKFNVLTGEATEASDATFELATIPTEDLKVVLDGTEQTFKYLAMDYLLVGAEQKNYDITVSFGDEAGIVNTLPVYSVPLQRNWRTNIVGNLLTTTETFTVVVDQEFDGMHNVAEDGTVESKGVKSNGVYYATIAEALTAAGTGTAEIELAAGTYAWPVQGRGATYPSTITVKGVDKDNVTINVTGTYYPDGSVVSFENLTMVRKDTDYQEGLMATFFHAKQENYTNCNIVGCLRLVVQESATITGCQFTNTTESGHNGYSIHYYGNTGSKVTISNSKFNVVSKAIYMYGDRQALQYDLTVNDCEFAASKTADKAAVQMHTEYGISGTLTINNSTATGFAEVNKGLWNEVVNSSTNIYNVAEGTVTNNFVKIIDGKQLITDGLVYEIATKTYEISTATGLSYFSGETIADGVTLKLMNEIDMQNATFKGMANTYSSSFVIDGNYQTIKNIKFETGAQHGLSPATGLVGVFANVGANPTLEVKNLTIENASLAEGSTWAGAIIGYAQGKHTLTNVHVKASDLNGTKKIGGLVGIVEASGTLYAKECSVTGTKVNASEKQAGGLIGYTAGTTTLENCSVSGNTVTAGNTETVGDIVGEDPDGKTTIK